MHSAGVVKESFWFKIIKWEMGQQKLRIFIFLKKFSGEQRLHKTCLRYRRPLTIIKILGVYILIVY